MYDNANSKKNSKMVKNISGATSVIDNSRNANKAKWKVDKEIYYGKDNEEKEDKQISKSKETCYLYLFKLRESHKNPLSSLFPI